MPSDDKLRLREMGHLAADFTLKKAFNSKDEAKRHIRSSRHIRVTDLRPYRCFVCGAWHIGNQPPKGKR